eukprot:TRINITY_DN3095_c0_g1_i1.p1 TRINITY_DN3095_c0_g1~~TRINITY_DN3095_c0_g1_i1.p1  ORF type:complete len:104 (-),score=1.03 TRINITY_DN3095_c0_g1_i1:73-384(-)
MKYLGSVLCEGMLESGRTKPYHLYSSRYHPKDFSFPRANVTYYTVFLKFVFVLLFSFVSSLAVYFSGIVPFLLVPYFPQQERLPNSSNWRSTSENHKSCIFIN